MSDERTRERLEERIGEIRRDVREIEHHLTRRARFWSRVSEKAFLLTAMTVAVVTATTIVERQKR